MIRVFIATALVLSALSAKAGEPAASRISSALNHGHCVEAFAKLTPGVEPEVALQVANRCAQLGHSVEAIESYQIYLDQATSASDFERARVRDKISNLEAFVARILVTADLADSEIRVDGRIVGKTPLLWGVVVAPGRHDVRVRARSYPEHRRIMTIASGDKQVFDVRFIELEEVVAARSQYFRTRNATIGVGIAALAFAAAGTGVVASLKSDYDRYNTTRLPDQNFNAVRSQASNWELQADVGYGLWGAAALLAVVDVILATRFVEAKHKYDEFPLSVIGGNSSSSILFRGNF